jgi:hypothetical protein
LGLTHLGLLALKQYWAKGIKMNSALRMVGLIALIVVAASATEARSAPPVGPSDLGTLTVPFTTAFGNGFGDPSGFPVVQPPSGPWAGLHFNFTDAYTFNYAPTSTFNSFVATIDLGSVLGITNFQAAVFPGTPLLAGTYVGSSGTTSGAVIGLGWTGTGPTITLADPALPGGQYTLEVRGLITGAAGGSYAGVMNITPVPEASSFTMMLVGLGIAGVVVVRRRRRRS